MILQKQSKKIRPRKTKKRKPLKKTRRMILQKPSKKIRLRK
jgi:hypothetical protein